MASWVRMMAVVLLVAGACGHPHSPPCEDVREELEALRVENQRLEEQVADLKKLVAEMDFELDAYRPYRKYHRIRRPRGAPGIVVSVKSSEVGTFVTISVGSKGHVRIGDEYHLSRGPRYVGKIDICRVNKDSAVGRFDEKFKGKDAPPQVDDKAWAD